MAKTKKIQLDSAPLVGMDAETTMDNVRLATQALSEMFGYASGIYFTNDAKPSSDVDSGMLAGTHVLLKALCDASAFAQLQIRQEHSELVKELETNKKG